MKNIKKSEISLILKDADPQSIQGEVNVDKEKNEFSINVKGKFIVKESKLMESKMSKEEMTQFSLIIKEAIKESNKFLTEEIVSIKDELKIIKSDIQELKSDVNVLKSDVNVLKSDMIEVKADIKAIKNTPTMKKELGL